jgi:signal transduction histidine kinase
MDVDEVIDVYLEQVAARGRYVCTVMLYAFDKVGQRTAAIIRGRWTPREGRVHLEERLPYTRDAFDPLLDAGQTVTIADFRRDPRVSAELRCIQSGNKRPAWAMIPLLVRSQRIGLVILRYPFVHRWSETDLQPYQATAAQLAAAIDSRQQHLLLIERGQRLAVLEERQRLARELRDSVTQLVFSMTLIAQSIAPAWRRDSAEGERRVTRLLELSQSTLTEMRALVAELRPAEDAAVASAAEGAMPEISRVRRDGLEAALQVHIADITRDGLHIDLDTTAYKRQPLAQEEALYRIVQEALNNIVKHAHARRIEITLRAVGGLTSLTVRDDGRGFAIEPAGVANGVRSRTSGGLGLRIMRERAEALGGRIDVVSAPGKGTIVDVRLPQEDERP